MASRNTVTTDHDTIRDWAQQRGGRPAAVKGTGSAADPGVLRIDFPGHGEDDAFEHITWDAWFRKLEENGLAVVLQEKTADGKISRFNKIVSRSDGADRAAGDT